MKKLLLPVLACGIYISAFAQNDAAPCCGIISKNSKNNTVIARDNTTGRLYQFKADALDINAVKAGDPVIIVQNKITAINGATRAYVTVRPDYLEPCCSVVSIEPDPVEPCCNVVSFKNNVSGAMSQFKAPKNISGTLRVGDPVYAEPLGVKNMQPDRDEPISEFAIVQSSFGNSNGQMASYGYPATSGDGATGNANAAAKWVITPVSAMKGVLGRLDINWPAGVDRWILFYQPADNKYMGSVSTNDKIFTISPGEYRFLITDVPVENVPIQKGHETRIKMGFLNVVSEGGFYLYNDTKEKLYTTYDKPKKIALPVGNYQLKLGGQFYPFTIKDKETVEY